MTERPQDETPIRFALLWLGGLVVRSAHAGIRDYDDKQGSAFSEKCTSGLDPVQPETW